MNKKNKIYMVCDGSPINFESEYSVKEIATKIEDEKRYETDSFIEVGEGIYVNPYSVSLVGEVKQDNQMIFRLGSENLGRVVIDSINSTLKQTSESLINI